MSFTAAAVYASGGLPPPQSTPTWMGGSPPPDGVLDTGSGVGVRGGGGRIAGGVVDEEVAAGSGERRDGHARRRWPARAATCRRRPILSRAAARGPADPAGEAGRAAPHPVSNGPGGLGGGLHVVHAAGTGRRWTRVPLEEGGSWEAVAGTQAAVAGAGAAGRRRLVVHS